MNREVRNNLIFLAIFLALALPGAVILFKKKLDPNAPPMYLPAPAYTDRLFNDPSPAPPNASRVVPPLTLAWLRELRGTPGPTDALVPLDPPVMDAEHRTQVLSLAREAEKLTLLVVLWDAAGPFRQSDVTAQLVTSAGTIDAAAITGQVVELPVKVRRDQQDRGFIRPPGAVTTLTLEFLLEDSSSELENLLVSAHATRLISMTTISVPVPASR